MTAHAHGHKLHNYDGDTQLVAKMSCSLCYDAGNILIATRIANMMIARIVTLSIKSLPNHQLQHRLTTDSITCDDVHRTTKRYTSRPSIGNSLHSFVILEAPSLTQSTMVAPDMSFISQMLQIY